MSVAFCFDLDGTVTTTEILPCIASDLGIADEIATLTRATMDGLIPFDVSLRLRCLILGQVPAQRVRDIVKSISLDSRVLAFIQANRENSFLVTGNLDIWVEPIAEMCGCRLFASKAATNGTHLRLDSILNKGDAVEEVRTLGFERVVAVGDGANDIPMLEAADVAIAFGGVHFPARGVVGISDYIVNDGAALCSLLQALS